MSACAWVELAKGARRFPRLMLAITSFPIAFHLNRPWYCLYSLASFRIYAPPKARGYRNGDEATVRYDHEFGLEKRYYLAVFENPMIQQFLDRCCCVRIRASPLALVVKADAVMYVNSISRTILLLLYYLEIAITISVLEPSRDEPNGVEVPIISLPATTESKSFIFDDTSYNLTFLGNQLPRNEVINTLSDAIETIKDLIQEHLTYPVTDGHFEYCRSDHNVVIKVQTGVGSSLSWAQLSHILQGLNLAVDQDPQRYCQELDFYTASSHQSEALHGTLRHISPSANQVQQKSTGGPSTSSASIHLKESPLTPLAKRGDSETNISSILAVGSVPVNYLIPGTHDTLKITLYPDAIPPFKVRDALHRIYYDLAVHSHSDPSGIVPKNRYRYNDDDGVSAAISVSNIHRLRWWQLDEVFKGLSYFMTGTNPTSPKASETHYQALKFSIFIEGFGYLGNGFVGYSEPEGPTLEKRRMPLDKSILQLPGSDTPRNQSMATLTAGTRVPIPGTSVTLEIVLIHSLIPSAELVAMLSDARSSITSSITRRPDAVVTRNWFEHRATLNEGDESILILIHPYVGQIITWRVVDDVIRGLLQIIYVNSKTYVPGLRFDVNVAGRGRIALGQVWRTKEWDNISKRTAAPQLVLPSDASLAHTQNISAPSPLAVETNIVYPIVNSPISLVFTELGSFTIPIDTVNDFFVGVLEDIEDSVLASPNKPMSPHLWYFKHQTPRGGKVMSISIYNHSARTISWIQLQKLLKGLEVFMLSQRRTMVFDIHLDGHGSVAEGLVWYTPPRIFDATADVGREVEDGLDSQNFNSSASRDGHPSLNTTLARPDNLTSSVATFYPVPSTPVILHITPRGTSVPCIYISSCLANALHRIAGRVASEPNAPIESNSFMHACRESHAAFTYMGYDRNNLITWQKLHWALAGLLKFSEQSGQSCMAMVAEVDISERADPSLPQRYGCIILWATGDDANVADD